VRTEKEDSGRYLQHLVKCVKQYLSSTGKQKKVPNEREYPFSFLTMRESRVAARNSPQPPDKKVV
jgi:hypothetical protein